MEEGASMNVAELIDALEDLEYARPEKKDWIGVRIEQPNVFEGKVRKETVLDVDIGSVELSEDGDYIVIKTN